jgi:hypothetical protein
MAGQRGRLFEAHLMPPIYYIGVIYLALFALALLIKET